MTTPPSLEDTAASDKEPNTPPAPTTNAYDPDDLLLSSKEAFQHRMERLFGYPVPQRMASKLHTFWRRAQEAPITWSTTPEEILPLTYLIHWHNALRLIPGPVILDPCAGHGWILATLADELPSLAAEAVFCNNDINHNLPTHLHFDAASSEEWDHAAPDPVDIIITSCPFEITDAMLPEFVIRAKLFVALHCQSDFIQNGPSYRRSYWAWLQSQGRTAEIRGLPRAKNRNTRRCTWLLIFASAEIKESLWQGLAESCTLFT
jgi:hypothetical protein